MRKYIVAAVLIGAFATPALAVETGAGITSWASTPLATKCSVVDRDGPGHENDGRV